MLPGHDIALRYQYDLQCAPLLLNSWKCHEVISPFVKVVLSALDVILSDPEAWDSAQVPRIVIGVNLCAVGVKTVTPFLDGLPCE